MIWALFLVCYFMCTKFTTSKQHVFIFEHTRKWWNNPRSYVCFWENLNIWGRYQSRTSRHWCCTYSWMSMTSHTRPCRSCTSCRPTLKTNPYWIDSLIIWDDDQITKMSSDCSGLVSSKYRIVKTIYELGQRWLPKKTVVMKKKN